MALSTPTSCCWAEGAEGPEGRRRPRFGKRLQPLAVLVKHGKAESDSTINPKCFCFFSFFSSCFFVLFCYEVSKKWIRSGLLQAKERNMKIFGTSYSVQVFPCNKKPATTPQSGGTTHEPHRTQRTAQRCICKVPRLNPAPICCCGENMAKPVGPVGRIFHFVDRAVSA